jgi:DNA invertase Pin-like site-specific DNA recombinase
MLDRDELPGYRVVSLCRTSNISKDADSSINRQDKKLQKEFDKLSNEFEAEMISTLHRKESASSMDRASIDKIEKMAKNEEFDVLMVWAIHRLTRANPWETMRFLLTLEAHDIIIYSHRDGYFSWDDPDDATKLIDRVTNSREWRNEIVRGSIAGCRDILANGHWPYGDLGYGLKDVDEDGIVIKEGYESVISSVFKEYLECEDVGEAQEMVKNHIENRDIGVPAPSEGQVEKVLENELFIGELRIKETGELVREKEDLKIIDPSVFAKVKEISQKSDNNGNDDRNYDKQEFPSFIYRLISRFGQEYVVENISAIRWCCSECQSVNINVSDTCIEYWDISLPKIYCNDCGYQGAAIRLKGLNEIDYSLPFVCPYCQKTGGFEFSQIDLEGEIDQLYKYICGQCEEWFMSDKDPDSNHRALQSENRINIRSTQSGSSDSDGSNQSDSARQQVTDTDVFTALQSLVRTKLPQSETAQNVIVTTAKTLNEDGPLTAAELKSQLWCDYGEEYASKDSLWESTITRYFDELPGFAKPKYNQYDFNQQEIQLLLEGYVESENE